MCRITSLTQTTSLTAIRVPVISELRPHSDICMSLEGHHVLVAPNPYERY